MSHLPAVSPSAASISNASHERVVPLSRLDRGTLDDLDRALETEWIETDGLGGFAASTVHLCPARRYHGLLVSRVPGECERHLFLARFAERLHVGSSTLEPSMARYAGELVPARNVALESFELAPHPVWTYAAGDVRLVREVQMMRGERTVLTRYRYEGPRTALLELRPLCPFRRADHLTVENDSLDPSCEPVPNGVRVRPYASLPALTIVLRTARRSEPAQVFEEDPVWFRGIEYPLDAERGYPGSEEQWSPGVLRIQLAPGEDVCLLASIEVRPEPSTPPDPRAVWERATSARAAWLPRGCATPRERVALAAGDFLYRTDAGRLGVVAGFPWFLEWGRDTFIALPGLTLARGQVAACGEALEGALAFLRDGLLPNVFGTNPEASHYGSADAALWFARAVRMYELACGSRTSVRRRFLPALESIARAYERGTALGMEVDDGGLLRAGAGNLNATWMDAVTSTGPVTPRNGCAVELNALWIFLLRYLEELTRGDDKWAHKRERAEASFRARFWLADAGRLADVWDPDRSEPADRAIRPNMVIAAALEFSPLTPAERASVVRCAREELLTPRGLRTLAASHADYVGRYAGGPEERDGAYHQGTVWPWLLGFYTEAALRAESGTGAAQHEELARLWDGFAAELDTHGLEHVSEVFCGDGPHTGGGSFAQAWNSAEMLRALVMLEGGLDAHVDGGSA